LLPLAQTYCIKKAGLCIRSPFILGDQFMPLLSISELLCIIVINRLTSLFSLDAPWGYSWLIIYSLKKSSLGCGQKSRFPFYSSKAWREDLQMFTFLIPRQPPGDSLATKKRISLDWQFTSAKDHIKFQRLYPSRP
jgi:hypothetical protein